MTNKMWGGRFSKATNELLEDLNASIKYDYRLAKYDIEVSIAHIMMLAKSGVIQKEECNLIVDGLKKVQKEISDGKFEFKKKLEDIHMNIESRLTEIIGPIAGKLHTARSRNDQVATDIRLFLIEKINGLVELIKENQKTLSQQALDNFDNRPDKNRLSLDTKDFDINFLRGVSFEDGAATLTELSGTIIGASLFSMLSEKIKKSCRVLVSGGGRKNKSLIQNIKSRISKNLLIVPIDDFGVDGDYVESQAFAFLAIRSFLELPISFPDTTGCKSPTTGGEVVKNF